MILSDFIVEEGKEDEFYEKEERFIEIQLKLKKLTQINRVLEARLNKLAKERAAIRDEINELKVEFFELEKYFSSKFNKGVHIAKEIDELLRTIKNIDSETERIKYICSNRKIELLFMHTDFSKYL